MELGGFQRMHMHTHININTPGKACTQTSLTEYSLHKTLILLDIMWNFNNKSNK
jgi:hypothetical protein